MQWQKQQMVETHAVYLKVTKQVSDQKEIILIYIIKSSDYTWRSKKLRKALFVHSVCANFCLNTHSVCANFSLNTHSVCTNFGLIAHSPVYAVILLK